MAECGASSTEPAEEHFNKNPRTDEGKIEGKLTCLVHDASLGEFNLFIDAASTPPKFFFRSLATSNKKIAKNLLLKRWPGADLKPVTKLPGCAHLFPLTLTPDTLVWCDASQSLLALKKVVKDFHILATSLHAHGSWKLGEFPSKLIVKTEKAVDLEAPNLLQVKAASDSCKDSAVLLAWGIRMNETTKELVPSALVLCNSKQFSLHAGSEMHF